jgi:hypothetical protein
MTSRAGRVVLFGGYQMSGFLDDTWEWDGSAWSQVAVTGPSGRAYPAMAEYDGKAVLFGGLDSFGQPLSDTWEWDGTNWTEMNVPGPPARFRAAMTSFQGKVILTGGDMGNGTPTYVDTWQWDGTAWTQLQVSSPDEIEHVMAPVGCDLVLSGFNHYVFFGGTYENETEVWNGTAWSTPSPGLAPSRRQWPVMAPTSAGAILFGGFDNDSNSGGVLADTWLWDGATWTKLPVSGPPGRMNAAMASY